MKNLSVVVPCYNSQAYMHKAIRSVLVGGEDVELIIVNDGSKDDTLPIARRYEKKYPSIVKVIDKENGGHGDAVMAGLNAATGRFFKVLDSDDYLSVRAFRKVLQTLKTMVEDEDEADMVLANYVYDKQGATRKRVVSYRNVFPDGETVPIHRAHHFRTGQYILMHSVIYRTELLKTCHLFLPKHTFYVDNIYVYAPMPFVKTVHYVDVNLYRYYIGRSDQSVNESVMIGRVDQQLRVTRILIDLYDLRDVENRRLKRYLASYLGIMMTVSTCLLYKIGDVEALKKKRELWQYLKINNPEGYRLVKASLIGAGCHIPGETGRKITLQGYRLANFMFGFN